MVSKKKKKVCVTVTSAIQHVFTLILTKKNLVSLVFLWRGSAVYDKKSSAKEVATVSKGF